MMTQDDDLEAPAQLVSAFKSLPSEKVFVPPSVDQAVLLAARRQLSGQVRQRSPWWRWRLWVAASAVSVALVVLPRLMSNRPQPSLGRSAKSEDVNRDGQIDILDAFALAKELKSGHPPGPGLDINGDGVVDEKDVATIAARAVRLDKGSRS